MAIPLAALPSATRRTIQIFPESGPVLGPVGPVPWPVPWPVPASPVAPPRRAAAPLNARAEPFVQPRVWSSLRPAAAAAAPPSPAIRTAIRSVAQEEPAYQSGYQSGTHSGVNTLNSGTHSGRVGGTALRTGCEATPKATPKATAKAMPTSAGSLGHSHAAPAERRRHWRDLSPSSQSSVQMQILKRALGGGHAASEPVPACASAYTSAHPHYGATAPDAPARGDAESCFVRVAPSPRPDPSLSPNTIAASPS